MADRVLEDRDAAMKIRMWPRLPCPDALPTDSNVAACLLAPNLGRQRSRLPTVAESRRTPGSCLPRLEPNHKKSALTTDISNWLARTPS